MRTVLLAAVLALPASGHETWLLPDRFAVKPNEAVRIVATTGEAFPEAETPIKPARIAALERRIGGRAEAVKLGEAGATALQLVPTFAEAGVAAVWLSLKPKEIELSDEKVALYLDEVGATADVRKLWAAQKGRQPWKETYTKHAKTFVAVGDVGRDESWRKPVGMALELVPLADPFAAKGGQEFAVRMLLDGKPLAGAPVGVMAKGVERAFVVTDADGKAVLKLPKAGPAMVFTVHLRPEGESGRWLGDFSTLTLAGGK